MPWKPSEPGEVPTLGWYVLDWMSELLARPAVDEYEPFSPYREQEDFILRWYEIDPLTGRFVYGRGLLGRPRGWGKSPILGGLCIVEGLADVLFDGWDADGQPVGRPWRTVRTPMVHVAAVSEDQTNNTWQPMIEMLHEDAPIHRAYPGIEPFDTVVNLPRGKIEKRTSSGRTVKGAPTTFAVLDQALALDTPIPTPDGWRMMGDLEAGDFVFGTGGPTKVVAAKPVSVEHDCYRVTFADGTSVVASAGHLWHSRRTSWPAKYDKVRTTAEMMDGYRYRIPAAKPIPLPEADLPVHPYLLGVWLGDGTRGKCEISVSERDCEALRRNLAQVGVESWPRRYKATEQGWGGIAAVNLSFTRARGFAMCDRPEPAKALSALDCYTDKHVPGVYLDGSIEQRTQLVRGLMDSDGCVTEAGTCTFVNTNGRVVGAFVELIRSLGQVTSGAKWVADDRYTGGGKYRVDFTPSGGLMPVALPRKVARVRQHSRGPGWVSITSIEPVDRVPVRCIAVDAEDHLFAFGEAGHFTHNTEEWVPSNGGPALAQKIRTNTAKNGGRTIESPNAFIPGENSVAEKSAATATAAREGRTKLDQPILWDHREAPPETDIGDRDSLVHGLRVSYGDSSGHPGGCVIHDPPCAPGHVDLEAQIAIIWDPATDIQTARSDYLNQITHASDSWVSSPEWGACFSGSAGKADGFVPLADKDVIVLGFDGSTGRKKGKADATALIGCRVSDGHLFELGEKSVWEPPRREMSTRDRAKTGDDSYWQPPVAEVDATIRMAFKRYTVVGFYADPSGWTEQIAKWEAAFGAQLHPKVRASGQSKIAAWPRGKDTNAVEAVKALHTAIEHAECSHDGSLALTQHVLHARKRQVRAGYLLYKAYPDSPDKIDAAYAAVMAWKARLDAVAAGVGRRKKRVVARIR